MKFKDYVRAIKEEALRQMRTCFEEQNKYDHKDRPALELAVDAVVKNVAIKFKTSEKSIIYFLLWNAIEPEKIESLPSEKISPTKESKGEKE